MEKTKTEIIFREKYVEMNGCTKIIINSTDTDIVALAVSCFSMLNIETLWIQYGRGKMFHWMPIHTCMIPPSLGPRAKALPLWHFFLVFTTLKKQLKFLENLVSDLTCGCLYDRAGAAKMAHEAKARYVCMKTKVI